jgi:hypothetical protein
MSSELKARHDEFNQWVQYVRDPAQKQAEGIRVIEVKGASAEYEIAQLPNGFAIHWSLRCRNGGVSVPWMVLQTRKECLNAFTDAAQRHFAGEKILEKFDGGLFGFIEPEIDEARTKQQIAISNIVKRQRAN